MICYDTKGQDKPFTIFIDFEDNSSVQEESSRYQLFQALLSS